MKIDLLGVTDEREWYDLLERRSLRLQSRINPILRALCFEASQRSRLLAVAMTQFKDANGTPNVDFLSDQERAALSRPDGSFRLSLYKVFLFQHVAAAIKAGNLNLRRSYKYRPIDSYLIHPERWKEQRGHLLERAGLTEFSDPKPLLASLKEALHAQY